MKKLLAVMGSPRKNKNTDYLLNHVLSTLKSEEVEIKKIYLKDLNISPCTGCEGCGKVGACVIGDDMSELYQAFEDCDGMIIATPLYFNTVSSLTKIMIDRCQVYWSRKYVLKEKDIFTTKSRIGMLITVGGAPFRPNQFEACIPVVDLFFKAINMTYKHEILVSNTDENPVWDSEKVLSHAETIALNFWD